MSTQEQTAERSRKLNNLYLEANKLMTQRLRFRCNPKNLAGLRRRENAAYLTVAFTMFIKYVILYLRRIARPSPPAAPPSYRK